MSQEIFRKLRQMLMEKLDVYRELTDQEILETIDELIVNTLRESGVSLKEKVQLRQELFYSVRKLDVLQELIEDETVTEYTKDETRTYNIRKILKDWDQVDGVSITIKQDDEVPADE